MKAVVTKIIKNKAFILQLDGAFAKIPNKGYVLGQEIYTANTGGSSMNKLAKVLSSAAIFIACIVLGGAATYAYLTPHSYMSIDINPSIVLELNIFDRVINAHGYNEDGNEIIEQIEVKTNQLMMH